MRKIIYTTNSIESLNYQLRKIIKNRGHFPNDDAVVKLLWLAIRDIEDKRARNGPRKLAGPATNARHHPSWSKVRSCRVERRLRRAQPGLPRPAGAGPVTGEARTAGFLHPGQHRRRAAAVNTAPSRTAASLTAASTGTPSRAEEPPPQPQDQQPVYTDNLTSSCNTALERHLHNALGVRFAEQPGTDPGKRPIREIVGVDPRLNQRWSTRRRHINLRRGELAVQFQTDHGRPPTAVSTAAGAAGEPGNPRRQTRTPL